MVGNIIPNFQEDLHLDDELFYEKHSDTFDHISEVRVYKVLYKLVERYRIFKVIYGYYYHPDGSFVYPGGQIDFIVYKEKKGFALIEVKGTKQQDYFYNSYAKATKQLMRANDALKKQIDGLRRYNITIFPSYSLNDIQKKDVKYKYLIDKKEFELWENDNEKVKSYFDDFFNEERYEGELKRRTINWINDVFDIDGYNKELEKERVAKEQILINYKTKVLDSVKNSGYNCFLIQGYSGTGKTFIAMNMAIKSDKNTLFIVRTVELFQSIEKYFDEHLEKENECYTTYIYPNGKNKIKEYVEYKLGNNNNLRLYRLNSKYNKKAFEDNIIAYDLIILDEVQDIKSEIIDLLFNQCLLNENKNELIKNKMLYLIGDNRQFVSDKYHNENEFEEVRNIIKEKKKNNKILYLDLNDDNCRNNVEIRNFVYKLCDRKRLYIDRIKGIKVFFLEKENYNVNEKLIESIKDSQRVIYINDINDKRTTQLREMTGKKNDFDLMIYRLIKGCEYNSVVVLELNIKYILQDINNEKERRLLSLIAGRAKQELSLVFYIENELPELVQKEKNDIKKILVDEYNFDEDCFWD